MQKKIVALAVAGLSTAAFAQTNVTIYGVADVSGQGTTISGAKDPATPQTDGSTFNLQSNSSLIGFKGTEDLGNGLKALFQAETNLNLNGGSTGVSVGTTNSAFGGLRDSFVGVSSKYGTGMAGYLSTPFRSSLNSFDVMPGATGTGQIENMMGEMRFGGSGLAYDSSIRATAVAYAMPRCTVLTLRLLTLVRTTTVQPTRHLLVAAVVPLLMVKLRHVRLRHKALGASTWVGLATA